jgi:hypothetical protein
MFSEIVAKYDRLIERFHHGRLFLIFACLLLASIALFIRTIGRDDARKQFWAAVAILAVCFLFAPGGDTENHVLRIIALSEQLKQATPSLMLTNPSTGNAFPVFVYYSFVPYIPGVILHLVGIPTFWALQATMLGAFLVLVFGLKSMMADLKQSWPRIAEPYFYQAAILFISSNYVCGLWVYRAALGETWAYAFMPWAISYMLRPRSLGMLTVTLCLQICIHPLVFAHSFLCEVLVALGLRTDKLALIVTLTRCGLAFLFALSLSILFWLPQMLSLHSVLGLNGIPTAFPDTFLTLGELFDPRFPVNLGVFLPAAVMLLVVSRHRLPKGFWLLSSCFALLLAMQTIYLREITLRVPFLQQSQFVWRLMFPTGFVGLGAIVAANLDSSSKISRIFTAFASISVLLFSVTQIVRSPSNLAYIGDAKYTENENLATELQTSNLWGINLFAPNYGSLPDGCIHLAGEVQFATYNELRTGVESRREFIAVENGPVSFVRYIAEDRPAAISSCDKSLLLGPLKSGAHVHVDESELRFLLTGRILTLLILAALMMTFQLRKLLAQGAIYRFLSQ